MVRDSDFGIGGKPIDATSTAYAKDTPIVQYVIEIIVILIFLKFNYIE